MSAATLFRLSGLALLLGGTLGAIGLLIHPPGHELAQQLSPTWVPAHALILLGWLLVILGLPGLYTRQAAHSGPLGLVAIVVALPAAALRVAVQVYEIFVIAILAADPSLQALTGSQGALERGPMGLLLAVVMLGSGASYILLGLATMHAALLPRRGGRAPLRRPGRAGPGRPRLRARIPGLGVVGLCPVQGHEHRACPRRRLAAPLRIGAGSVIGLLRRV